MSNAQATYVTLMNHNTVIETCVLCERDLCHCCSVLQCVAACCSVLQCAKGVAVRCSAAQCVASCCRHGYDVSQNGVLQSVAVCCSVFLRVAVCCSVLQCVAVRCSALQCVASCRRHGDDVVHKRSRFISVTYVACAFDIGLFNNDTGLFLHDTGLFHT